jgi:acetyl esterase
MNTTIVRPATLPAVVLEPAAQALADALASGGGPPLYTLSPDDARAVLDKAQSGEVAMPPAEIEQKTIPGGPDGRVLITVVRPVGANGRLPAVVYTHGGGWVLGNFATHERLVRDLAGQTGAAFVFVNYPRSPEARYPTAIEQVYATLTWIAERGGSWGWTEASWPSPVRASAAT